MKNIITFLLAMMVIFGCAKPPQQGNPHFVGRVVAVLAKDQQSVLVAWKEAGLGDNQNIDYEASAEGTATYVCVNKSGNCPNAANKVTVNGPVVATVTLASDQNGAIEGSLVLLPPGPGEFDCPGGQTLTLANVSFSNIQIKDVTNSVAAVATPDGLGATIFVCP